MDFSEITNQIARVALHYNYKKPPDFLLKLQDWIETVLRFIRNFLASFHIDMPALSDTRMASNIMQVLLSIGGIACLALFLFAVWKKMQQLDKQSQMARKGQTMSSERLDSAGWLAEADRQALRKDFREACRAIYFAALRRMDERKVMEYSPMRTNYEYYYALVRHQALAKNFRQLADCVELVWFGNKPATENDLAESQKFFQAIDAETQSIFNAAAIKAAAASSTSNGAHAK